MVAQLEHQFRLGKLSVQGLWFYCQVLLPYLTYCIPQHPPSLHIKVIKFFPMQPMLGAMQALTIVIKNASTSNFIGSAVLNLLQSQVWLHLS